VNCVCSDYLQWIFVADVLSVMFAERNFLLESCFADDAFNGRCLAFREGVYVFNLRRLCCC